MHEVVNINTHAIITAELSSSNVTDDKVLPNLFKQTRRKIHKILGESAYDTKQCYETARIKRAVSLISSRKRTTF
ncbi:Mobile element protein [Candidatus Enterovibrio altilux]|uniref:Mobile element protein n=1 Tax=Candidatus Enterovibrio altilux TaxID=1927128 RepID=A0A291B6I5_9GAMM|nr:Mobile element protein [Candidatus Enterovibrio luxaltus]